MTETSTAAHLGLVPLPRSVVPGDGTTSLSADLAIDAPPEWASIARRLLAPAAGLELPRSPQGALRIVQDPSLADEAYRLRVTPTGIAIDAGDDRGVNWAIQTLRQLLPAAAFGGTTDAPSTLPLVGISDQPSFGWRGVLLDVARHFMPLHDVLRFVDLMAMHKYNVLHLHLTDDQGWRFGSTRYPRLNEVSSWRTETRRQSESVGDGTPHGGFYTAEQLRALVGYAKQRGINIVPEMEFPGHVRALLAAYPELGNHPQNPQPTATTFGIFDEVLNLNDATMAVVFDLYEELLDIFPSTYVHVGGDECPRTEWLTSPDAQSLASRRGLPGAAHLQGWFTEQLRDWLAERGRQLVGWDEICDEGPLESAVAMAWRGAEHGLKAADAGMEVVMAPASHTYFDYYASDSEDEPYAIGGLTTTMQAYAFDPVAGMSGASRRRVLGTQCQVWTEYLPSLRRVEYALYPRACAHSEVAWSDPAGRSWEEFQPRLGVHLQRLAAMGVNFRPEAGPHPWQQGGSGTLRRA